METLAEGCSPGSEPTKTLKEVTGTSGLSGPEGSVGGALENGVRVCVTARVVETEVSVSRDVSGGELGFLEDAKVTGGSSQKEVEIEDGGGSKNVNSVEKVGENSNGSIGDGSSTKVEFNGDGISLVVEVGGSSVSVDESKRKRSRVSRRKEDSALKVEVKERRNLGNVIGSRDGKASLPENGGDPVEKIKEMTGLVAEMGKNNDGVAEEEGEKVKVNDEGEKNEDEEGEDMGGEEHEFLVGDYVWGKIKSHPWWPGQIYDSSDASEYAAKYRQRNRLLVAYFGDGTFAWCYPSQLKPFEENFEQMSKQSNSKSFVNAVQGAVDEIGKLVELEMTCSCVPIENQIGLTRLLAGNAGIKQGVSVPEGGVRRLSIAQLEPAEFLARLGCIAQAVSVTNLLEFMVLKSWLSVFYRAKGGHQLPIYHEPRAVAGLEDNVRNGVLDISDFNGQVEVPIHGPFEEDWLSSPVGHGFGQTSQTLSQKWPGISEDKLYQRRKQKSMAELMGEDMDVEIKIKNKKGYTAKEGTQSGKLASTSGKKKKGSDEAEIHGGNNLTSPRGRRKKTRLSGSPITTENKVLSVENDGGGGEEETKKGLVSRGRKKKKTSGVENDGGGAKEETEKSSVSRERKKSKYLSPPYTSLRRRERNSSSKKDREAESLKVSNIARMGERMTRAAGQLIGSPPIVKCSGDTFQKKLPKELGIGHDISGSPSHQIPKPDQNKMIDPMETTASANKVISEVRLVALNPLHLRENKSVDMTIGFLSTFRSSIFRNGSNFKIYNRRRPGRKRKSLDSEPGSLGKDLNRTDHNSTEHKSQRTRTNKKEAAKSDTPKLRQTTANKKEEAKWDRTKLKQADGKLDMKKKAKKTDGKASPAALLLTFAPGFSLPSKGDLITIFSKFGSLNESETEVLSDSCCARVVFLRSSNAEEAFNNSQKVNPFGVASVNYRVRYLSTASRPREFDGKSNPKASSLPNVGGKTPEDPPPPPPSQSSGVEASQLLFVRQKLETMTSMLEKSDGNMSQEMKSNLEGEIKDLLKKVSTMAQSSSS